MCLFHVLLKLRQTYGWTIHPVHVNHKFRPGAAEADQAYTEELCRQAGCSCRTFVYDCSAIAKELRLTAEEAGRKVRYEAFAAVAAELCARGVSRENICIAVAQNGDDQAETILFRILRGTGVDGLSGIAYERADEAGNRIVRPLLDVKKQDILQYCEDNDLQPRLDHTNDETLYTRNKIRLELIPYLQQEYNPAIKDTMIRLGKNAAADSDYLQSAAKQTYETLILQRDDNGILLSGEALRQQHRSIRSRILALAFEELGLTEGLSAVHFESCEAICVHPGPSAACHLPKGFYLTKVYDNVKAGRQEQGEEGEAAGDKKLPRLRITVKSAEAYRSAPPPKDRHGAFDYDVMEKTFGKGFEQRIFIGTRKAGDFITIGESRTKKIQDYFVDRKIPRKARETAPLLKIGNEVLWVLPGAGKGRFSAGYNVRNDTKTVICIEIICET